MASPQNPPAIIDASRMSSLHLENLRVDPGDGVLRGTAYLNFGYTATRLPHVHVYALNSSGRVVYTGCDKLSQDLLTNRTRFRKGSETFSVQIPKDLRDVQTIRVVAESGHEDCKLDDRRILKIF